MAKSPTPDQHNSLRSESVRTRQTAGSESPFSNLTRENPTKSNAIETPQLFLPKGEVALNGIDEKFQVNFPNGTTAFSIPWPLTPGRRHQHVGSQ